ncbi:hypothetical protein GGF43_006742, partial [Coemansia sp. RSA 2618]
MTRYERRGDVQTLALLACVLSMALAEADSADDVPTTVAATPASAPEKDMPPWMKAAASKKGRMPAHRNVSFRLPSSSTNSMHPSVVAAAAAAAAATANSLGLLDESQLLRSVAASRPTTPPLLAADALHPGINMSEDTTPPLLLPTSGMTTHVQPSDSEPPSPEILKALDSDEIKQNELMMAEGLDDTKAPSPETELEATLESGVQLYQGQRRVSSEQLAEHHDANSGSPAGPEAGENLWRRLRSNVLSRVHTVGGYGGTGNGAKIAAGDDVDAAVAMTSMATAVTPPAAAAASAGDSTEMRRGRLLAKHGIAGTRAEAPL